jgi:hypothetical protein
MSPATPIPKPTVVQSALRTTTERLAHELAQPTDTMPSWSTFEWQTARAAAAIHGIGPLLAVTLRWRGPPAWQAFLEDQKAQTEKRHRRIEALAKLLDHQAREAGIPMVGLKGAALHDIGLYRPGLRPMADLDFLVEEPDLAAATQLLEAQHFHMDLSYWKNRIFKPDGPKVGGLGEHCDYPIKVELHWRIRERLPLELTDISELIFPARPHPGINAYPSRIALLMHLVLHAAGSMVNREMRLLQLHDLALVCGTMRDQDWEEILQQGQLPGQGPWWFLPPLQLARRYYPNIVPSSVISRLQGSCPARLNRAVIRQCLTDFSLSSVWIRAFPGIHWPRSVAEGVRYMLGRVRPDAEARAIRKNDAASSPWAASDNPWHGRSQRSRIVRWITSRPTRPATMYVMRQTLALPLETLSMLTNENRPDGAPATVPFQGAPGG